MRGHRAIPTCLVILGATLLATAPTPQALPTPDAAALLCGVAPVDVVGGCLAWEHRYEGPSSGDDGPADLVTSADGTRVYMAGFTYVRPPENSGYDYAVVAYDASSGAIVWEDRYDGPAAGGGPARGDDFAMAAALSPDGARLFVTGLSFGYVDGVGASATGIATIAYDAVDGTRLWIARHHAAALAVDIGRDVATSPDGSLVYVTGTVANLDQDVAMLTYDAETGALLGAHHYNGPGARHDSNFFRSLTVTPDGAVFVAAQVYAGPTTGFDYGLLRYDAAGTFLGATLVDGGEGNVDRAFGVAAAPDGSFVYVTGRSRLAASDYDMATVAFDAAGAVAWTARYDGDGGVDEAFVVAASPDGAFVTVTGASVGGTTGYDYATVAYDAATGAERWVARMSSAGSATDVANMVAVSPDSAAVYATGRATGPSGASDQVTVAYNALSGAVLWRHDYTQPTAGDDIGRALAVDPGNALLFVTGDSHTSVAAGFDIATIALDLGGLGAVPLPPRPLP